MTIKNYTASKTPVKYAAEIEQILIEHGAAAIQKDIADGKIIALRFAVPTNVGRVSIQLPVNVDAVFKILEKDKKINRNVKVTFEQAEKTAWANLRDWVAAQMALISIGMVSMDQVFLPYVIGPDGRTLYEVAASKGFYLKEGSSEWQRQ